MHAVMLAWDIDESQQLAFAKANLLFADGTWAFESSACAPCGHE